MTTVNTSTTPVLSPLAVITPMANGVIALAMVSALSQSMSTLGMGFASYSNPHEELKSISRQIFILNTKIERQREGIVSLRHHKEKLMHDLKVTLLPSEVEMKRKYPKLYYSDRYLRDYEKQLDRMEVRMMLLKKRRKDLSIKLGLREGEDVERTRYAAMKKWKPSERSY